MARLSDTLKKANDAKAGLEVAVERDVAKYIERVDQVHDTRERVFLKKHSELDLDVSDLAEFEQDLEDFGKNDHSGAGGSSGGSADLKSGDAYAGTNPPKR